MIRLFDTLCRVFIVTVAVVTLYLCFLWPAYGQTPTPGSILRWQQDGDSPQITMWMLWLDGRQLMDIPRAQATPEATPNVYRWQLPWWLRDNQPELYLTACDASAGPPSCSEQSNAWPTRTPSFTPTLLPTSTPQPTWTPQLTQTPMPTYTPWPTYTPTNTPTITATPQPTPLRPIVLCIGADCVTVGP